MAAAPDTAPHHAVLRLVALGHTNPEISGTLRLSAQHWVKRLCHHYQAINRPHLVRRAHEQQDLTPDPDAAPPAGITSSDVALLRLISQGRTDGEIAGILDATEDHTRADVRRLLARWHARSRAHAVHLAYQTSVLPHGLTTPPTPPPAEPDATNPDTIGAALGCVLRALRDERGWTRKQLAAALRARGVEVSLAALTSYEQHSRQITVRRLIEVCDALGTPAHTVLQRAHTLQHPPAASDRIRLDLIALAAPGRPVPHELRAWARARLDQLPLAGDTVVEADPAVLPYLARLCQVDVADLARL